MVIFARRIGVLLAENLFERAVHDTDVSLFGFLDSNSTAVEYIALSAKCRDALELHIVTRQEQTKSWILQEAGLKSQYRYDAQEEISVSCTSP
jgi:hypothetical protein